MKFNTMFLACMSVFAFVNLSASEKPEEKKEEPAAVAHAAAPDIQMFLVAQAAAHMPAALAAEEDDVEMAEAIPANGAPVQQAFQLILPNQWRYDTPPNQIVEGPVADVPAIAALQQQNPQQNN